MSSGLYKFGCDMFLWTPIELSSTGLRMEFNLQYNVLLSYVTIKGYDTAETTLILMSLFA